MAIRSAGSPSAPIRPFAPLYDERFEHDACGVGFVAESRLGHTARVLPLALEGLARLTHRGAIAADAKTGDGAGVTLPLSPSLRHRILDEAGLHVPADEPVAVGMIFLPPASAARRAARRVVERVLAAEGLRRLGWRTVPVDPSVLGPQASSSCPAVEQVVVAPERRREWVGGMNFDQRLLLARREIEREAQATPGLETLHVPSLSAQTIVYKGLFVGSELGAFYLDFGDSSLHVASAVFHQRYSTNTHPSWRLAQPFRFIAHNGEINTVRGNRAAMQGRAGSLGGGEFGRRLATQVKDGGRLLDPTGSDSTSLDEALELFVAAGWPLHAALTALIPEAPGLRSTPLPGLEAWQAAAASRIEPWDGPAALVFSDGRRIGAMLDRNGLRPLAYEIHHDGLVVAASEMGTLDLPPAGIIRRARLDPGGLLVVDTESGLILEDAAAKADAIGSFVISTPTAAPGALAPDPVPAGAPADARARILFGLDAEQLRLVVRTMAGTGREPTWSMGDDTPLAVLARKPRPISAYLRQSFAQVTNPPIDPERERVVVSLDVVVGRRTPLLDPPGQPPVAAVHLASPVLDSATFARFADAARTDASWPLGIGAPGLERRLAAIGREVAAAARRGVELIVISDAAAGPERLPVPSLLAVGVAHATLRKLGLRDRTDLLVDAGDAFDVHAIAMLIAAGASAVHPRIAFELASDVAGSRGHEELTAADTVANLVHAVEGGLRKVLARMGISTLASYRGSQLFEIVGLDAALAASAFPDAPCWPGATDAARLAAETIVRHQTAYVPAAPPALVDPGFVRYRGDGELHAFSPAVAKATQALASSHPIGVGPGTELAREYADAAVSDSLATYRGVVDRTAPAMVRDLLEPRRIGPPIALSRVEPAASIARRFVSSAMSLGSLSPEAHATLALGMRLLGGAANTGEGGEDPAQLERGPNGERRDASVKQVASGRFGVTAEYLAMAEQLEIKMAQGSKPGEGGQLPGAKVSELIATLRRAQPGQTIISPPPHHDIYSIEDLAQLITDLRAINPTARIGVKLVATTGVGTIAAGVAKAHADYVMISGHSGGTGASPLASIKHVGLPWELGLAETHQTLVHQGLRDRIVIRTDGGMQTGRDVLIAALLGAEEYGFGTAALLAMGCDMARQCHLDTCPTGIATQRADLRAKFTGTPEQVVEFFTAIAEDVRRELSAAGFRSINEAVGRVDRLAAKPDAPIDLDRIVDGPAWVPPAARRYDAPAGVGRLAVAPVASELDERLTAEATSELAAGRSARLSATISTDERTVGAVLSGELARDARAARALAGDGGADGGPLVQIALDGSAGQSLGAFLGAEVRIAVTGAANDYVGKGLSGGTIVVRPAPDAGFEAGDAAIAGNACLYGATSGRLHLVGRAGIRFAVRNSGAVGVVEGVGAHGCEYMTGGLVVVLGPIGRNFGAGMTGGRAFVWDPAGTASGSIERGSVTARALVDPARIDELQTLLAEHADAGSARAAALLARWSSARGEFLVVEPIVH